MKPLLEEVPRLPAMLMYVMQGYTLCVCHSYMCVFGGHAYMCAWQLLDFNGSSLVCSMVQLIDTQAVLVYNAY
jgi:hypothetical protein